MHSTIEVGVDRRTLSPTFGFRTPGEFLLSVQQAALNPARRDERLEPLRAPMLATAGSDEHGTYGLPQGAFLVPEAWAPRVLAIGNENDPAAGRTLPIEMTSPIVHVNARNDKDHTTTISGGLVLTRTPETVEVSSSRQEFERITLYATSLMGLTFATEEIVMDSAPAFTATLGAAYQDEHASQLFGERLHGSGVGEFAGVLDSGCLITVSKEVGQAAATITGENVVKMAARCWGYPQAVWVANHVARPALMKTHLLIGTELIPLWKSGTDGHPDFLCGRPVWFNEHAIGTVGTAGDLLCANWSQYLDATYQPLQGVGSIHARFVTHEHAFRFTSRNAGAPWWRVPLTPKRSTSTLSPFVILETRS